MTRQEFFERYDRVTKKICTFGDMLIKHTVGISRFDANYTRIPYEYKYKSQSKRAIGMDSTALRQTYDSIIIEHIRKDRDTDSIPPSVLLSYEDTGNFSIMVKEINTWFEKEPYINEMFKFADNGKPFGISERYADTQTSFSLSIGARSSFFSAQPYVVSDPLNNESYPGVIFKSHYGIIGCCTISEYFGMRHIVTNLLLNLYNNSINLLNHILLTLD